MAEQVLEQTSEDGKQPASIVGGYGRGRITPIRTTEQARDVANKRWHTAERMALKAIKDGPGGGSSWAEGVYTIVKAQAELAAEGERGSTPAANFVLKAARLLREPEVQYSPTGSLLSLTVSGPLADHLAALLLRLPQPPPQE